VEHFLKLSEVPEQNFPQLELKAKSQQEQVLLPVLIVVELSQLTESVKQRELVQQWVAALLVQQLL
jgi:hypothetical protein